MTQQGLDFMLGDFWSAWRALSESREAHRGNYMFAHASAVLASSAIEMFGDSRFRTELFQIQPAYIDVLDSLLAYLLTTALLYSDAPIKLHDKPVALLITGVPLPDDDQPVRDHLKRGGFGLRLTFSPDHFVQDVTEVIKRISGQKLSGYEG